MVVVDVDVIVSFDSMRPTSLKIADPDKLVLLFDHQVPAPTVRAANMAKDLREFVEKFGVKNYFPVGAARHLARPGGAGGYRPAGQDPGQRRLAHLLVGCAELPGPRHGPFGDALHPLQGPDVVPGRPDDQDRDSKGSCPSGCTRATSSTTSPGQYGDFAGRNLEWHGDGLASIDMDGRLTMATISAELSAEFSLFPYDSVLEQYLEGRAKWPFEPVFPDDDAEYDEVITVDLSLTRAPGRPPRQGGQQRQAGTGGGRAEGRPGVHRVVRQRPVERLRRRRRDRQGTSRSPRGRGSSSPRAARPS